LVSSTDVVRPAHNGCFAYEQARQLGLVSAVKESS